MTPTGLTRLYAAWRTIVGGSALATITLLLALPLAAQSVHLGAKGGLSIANLRGDDVQDEFTDTDWRSGPTAGAFLTYRFNRFFAVQPEVLYTQKGAKVNLIDEGEALSGKLVLGYVEIPLLLKAMIPIDYEGNNALYFSAGPSLNFKSDCDVTAGAEGIELTMDCDDLDTPITTVDYALIVGGGWSFPVRGITFTIDGRYAFGLATIDDSDPAADVKNHSYAVTFGLSFPLWQGPRTLTAMR